jgi:ABC-type phosphate transport system substrate-binding protein
MTRRSTFKPAAAAAAVVATMLMLLLTTTSMLLVVVDAGSTVLSVHGSGTTNPSKCYWAIMEQIMAQTLHPTRLTYRAVGSTTGIAEFKTPGAPGASFGSGDLPLSAEDYKEVTVNQNDEIVQLPVVLGAVNFFHNVPLVNEANAPVMNHLNMTACLLARIFNRQIVNWNDKGIQQLNPNMVLLENDSLPITVARRDKGSSSTDSITNVRCRFLF